MYVCIYISARKKIMKKFLFKVNAHNYESSTCFFPISSLKKCSPSRILDGPFCFPNNSHFMFTWISLE